MSEANKRKFFWLAVILFFAALLGLAELYLMLNYQNKKPVEKRILSKDEKLEMLNDLAKPTEGKEMTLKEKTAILNALKLKK